MKKYSLIVLYNIIVVIFLLLLLEIAVRIFVPRINFSGTNSHLIIDSLYNDSPGIRADTKGFSGGVIKRSDSYNSWKYLKSVDKETHKLLFLGDSVTMGIGVENDSTYAGILNNGIDSINIINPSLIGYSSKDYLNVFNHFVIKNNFNLNFSSVIMFWTLNDIYSNYPDNISPDFSSNGLVNGIVNFLRKNSKAYHFLKNLFSDRSRVYYDYDKQFYTDSNPLLLRSIKNIDRIFSVCDSLEINFQLILLPYEFQIRNFNKSGIFNPQEILKAKLKKANMIIIDLKEVFRNDSEQSSDYYLYGDGIHFNNKGNALIADYLKDLLK